MLGVVGSSVSEYMNSRNIPLKKAAIDIVWNLKEPPQARKDFYYYNFTHGEKLDLAFTPDTYDCMKQAKAVMDHSKQQYNHYFKYYLFKFLGNFVFPSYWFDNKVDDLLKA